MSYKTAISRKIMSVPARRLRSARLLHGRILDYGCGRGGDSRQLKVKGYDPHWRPSDPGNGFDTILCTYVLCVIPSTRGRHNVVSDVVSRLNKGGKAYFTVRRDISDPGWRKNGTWQGQVGVPQGKSIWKNSSYETYVVSKD
jgi:hypothetical protein